MVTVPDDTPDTTPVPATTVAIAGEPLLHNPPARVLLNVTPDPIQTLR